MSSNPNFSLQIGGTLVPGKNVYITRPEDEMVYRLLLSGQYINILTSRQMGKSSLIANVAGRLEENGFIVAVFEITEIGISIDSTDWYKTLMQLIASGLDIENDINIEEWWEANPAKTNNQKLIEFFKHEVCCRLQAPVIIVLDEIDYTLRMPFADELFIAIRAIHNSRWKEPLFNNLTFCLAGVATAAELIKSPSITPYNIGRTIELRDFDFERDNLKLLSAKLNKDIKIGETILKQIMIWTDGHPFLTTNFCNQFIEREYYHPELSGSSKDIVEGIAGKAVSSKFAAIQSDEHFKTIVNILSRAQSRPDILDIYRLVYLDAYGETDQTDLSYALLKLSGLIKRTDENRLIVRNQLYRNIFDLGWISKVKSELSQAPLVTESTLPIGNYIFVSHSSDEDTVVQTLLKTLYNHKEINWVDSQELADRESDKTIENSIRNARHFLVFVSIHSLSSEWVQREVSASLDIAKFRQNDGYKVIAVVKPEVPIGLLSLLFTNEPIYVFLEESPVGITDAAHKIMASIGESSTIPRISVGERPTEELILQLADPHINEQDGLRRVAAIAELTYIPASSGNRSIVSRRYKFTAPIGSVEVEDIRWYIERYFQWPTGVFKTRAQKTEQRLPEWGNALFAAAIGGESAREPLRAWQRVALSDPRIVEQDSFRRAEATAELTYVPADNSRTIVSRRYKFTAPLGPLELEDIRWYIERYFQWPTGVFKERAQKTEQQLPEWGNALFAAAIGGESAREPLGAWQRAGRGGASSRRFSVQVDAEPMEGAAEAEAALFREAASDLLSLPWEILHDGKGYLSQGANGVRVRRRLPNRQETTAIQADLPIRVLLLSPRPEVDDAGKPVGYIDHRSSALPLVQAVENLGEALVKVDILHPATFAAMKAALKQARAEDDPYEIVHFDGHGVYDRRLGLGALCFEDSRDGGKLGRAAAGAGTCR